MSDQQPPTKPDESPPSPRIPSAYKYSWQFDEAMEKEREWPLQQEHRRLRLIRSVLWLCVLSYAALYSASYCFDWQRLHFWLALFFEEAPFHLVVWPVLGVYTWYVSKGVEPRRLITRKLLCFGCGYSLIGLPVDDEHRGRCPECGRDYNLGEYVHPKTPEKYPLPFDVEAPDKPAPTDTDI